MIKYIITQKIVLLFVLFVPFGFTFGQPPVNAVCPETWQNKINAVVRINDNKGHSFSGVLVNTTKGADNDQHFILTSNTWIHYSSNGNPPDLSNYTFYWHYESPWCHSDVTPNQITTTGARLVARSDYGGFALLELYDDPAEQWDITPYYMGWEHSGNEVTGTKTVIYHPGGGMKKIKTTNSNITQSINDILVYNCNGTNVPYYNCYLKVPLDYYPDIGAPLLNSNHRLFGYFSGKAFCIIPRPNFPCDHDFDRFGWAWEGTCNPDSTKRLKDWLDPLNTGGTALDGRRACQKTIMLSRPPISRQRPMVYHAEQNIISKQGIVNGWNVTYKAGSEIVLMCDNRGAGFHAQPGSNFHAYIEELDCSGTKSLSSPSPGGEYQNGIIDAPNLSSSQFQVPYEINLFPNPNTGTFNIEANFPLTEIASLKITNLLGIPVYETQKLTSNNIQLQTSAPGQYFVIMMLKDGSMLTQKMMIQR